MDPSLFDRLLLEGESSRLDYKREQYRIVNATNDDKAEFVKDLLAMANAWRDSDAYILLGVAEEQGQPATVVGISQSLDDASLQQLLKDKTNRPVEFRYSEFEIAGVRVAAIHVPVQRRPSSLLKSFGRLDADAVYLRRGTSTVVADPDEIFRMGQTTAEQARIPLLEFEFADVTTRRALGHEFQLSRFALTPLSQEELPAVERPYQPGPFEFTVRSPFDSVPNPDYWTELRDYVGSSAAISAVGFVARNRSAAVAHGVRVEFRIPCSSTILVADQQPSRPLRQRSSFNVDTGRFAPAASPDVKVSRYGDTWHVEVLLGKIQPGAEVWTEDELYIGTLDVMQLRLEGTLFGDNFDPVSVTLHIDSHPTVREMTLNDLEAAIRPNDDD